MPAFIKGLSIRVNNPERRNRSIQATVRGLAMLVSPKALYLKLLAWDGAQYQPVAGATFDVVLPTATVHATTGATGEAVLNFDAPGLLISLQAASLPAGYKPVGTHQLTSKSKNFLTVTLLPASLPDYPVCLEIY